MRLLRFANLTLGGAPGDWRTFTVEHQGVTVSTQHHWERAGKVVLALFAVAPLTDLPGLDASGLVVVPEGPRRLAEQAIEQSADLLSVATGHARSLSSSRFVRAFRADDAADLDWLRGQRDLATAHKGVAAGRLTVDIGESEVSHILDRADGVALMGEALAQTHLTGRYRELLRVFERAFAESADRLVPPLAEFLSRRPGLGYSKTEVKRWVVRLRGPAVHADRHEPLLEVDLRPVVDRMLLAAYEVL